MQWVLIFLHSVVCCCVGTQMHEFDACNLVSAFSYVVEAHHLACYFGVDLLPSITSVLLL
jgi:hypothetical protein